MWQPRHNSFPIAQKTGNTSGHGMTREIILNSLFDELEPCAPSGYSAGLHIGATRPLVYRNTYDQQWQDEYETNSYMLRDPTIFWGISKIGSIRWSEIKLPDPFGVLEKAASYGLIYGAVISCGRITSRSIVEISRNDREFTDAEIWAVSEIVEKLHNAAKPPANLTEAQIEALRLLSEGYRHTAAAAELGISESALKARLKSAKNRLSAQTTIEAVKLAREYRFI